MKFGKGITEVMGLGVEEAVAEESKWRMSSFSRQRENLET